MSQDTFWSLWLASAGAFLWFCSFFFFVCVYVSDHPRDKMTFCVLCVLCSAVAMCAIHYV